MFVPVCCKFVYNSQSGTLIVQQHYTAPGKQSHRSLKSKVQNLVKTWPNAGLKEVLTDVTLGEKVFMVLFIKYNTANPAAQHCSPQPRAESHPVRC